jgi:hypothetical protein
MPMLFSYLVDERHMLGLFCLYRICQITMFFPDLSTTFWSLIHQNSFRIEHLNCSKGLLNEISDHKYQ